MVKSLKPAAGQDLEGFKPILRRHLPALDFDGTLPPVYRPPLIRNQVLQNRKPIEEEKFASIFVMKPIHHKQLPVHHIVDLVDWRGRSGNVGIGK